MSRLEQISNSWSNGLKLKWLEKGLCLYRVKGGLGKSFLFSGQKQG
jgi:hypothetical protein